MKLETPINHQIAIDFRTTYPAYRGQDFVTINDLLTTKKNTSNICILGRIIQGVNRIYRGGYHTEDVDTHGDVRTKIVLLATSLLSVELIIGAMIIASDKSTNHKKLML